MCLTLLQLLRAVWAVNPMTQPTTGLTPHQLRMEKLQVKAQARWMQLPADNCHHHQPVYQVLRQLALQRAHHYHPSWWITLWQWDIMKGRKLGTLWHSPSWRNVRWRLQLISHQYSSTSASITPTHTIRGIKWSQLVCNETIQNQVIIWWGGTTYQ